MTTAPDNALAQRDARNARREQARRRAPLPFTLDARVVVPPNPTEYQRLWDGLLQEESAYVGPNHSQAKG